MKQKRYAVRHWLYGYFISHYGAGLSQFGDSFDQAYVFPTQGSAQAWIDGYWWPIRGQFVIVEQTDA